MVRRAVVVGIAVLVLAAVLVVGAYKLYLRVKPVAPTAHDELSGIACPATASCWAVGSDGAVTGSDVLGETARPLVELVRRNRYYVEREPALDASNLALDDIACAGRDQCFAVGSDITGAVIARLTGGSTWQLVDNLPARTVGRSDILHAVACPSATECLAFGNRHDTRSYVLVWQSSTDVWAPVPSPLANSAFTSLGCASATLCFFGTTRQGVYERDGDQWVNVTALPHDAGVADVGCSSASDCVATFARTTTAYRWNGTTWATTQPAPGAKSVQLVSCTVGGCWVAASSASSSSSPELAEQVDGTWQLVSSPPALTAEVSQIACTTTRCLAVGAEHRRAPQPPFAWRAIVAVLRT